jgi:hypothetical protein
MAVGKRPEPRTVSVKLSGDFEGWECIAKADFRAGLLADLQSGNLASVIRVLGEIIVEHNFPDETGKLAATIADVDPYDGLISAGTAIFDAIGKLPNR